jgi:3-phosphoshikimate 1-carboxyvinyltransferase
MWGRSNRAYLCASGRISRVAMAKVEGSNPFIRFRQNSPTRVRGIEFIRAKETDRIGAMVTELRRAGITADEHQDGFTIHPAMPTPTRVQTYDDHRMAMSMALLGLCAPGIQIEDPGCVAKTYPGYFADLARLG